MPPKFFVTHSWNDNAFAKRLCDDLRANGLDGFFDVYSIKPGDVISDKIAHGLESCDIYVPVLSHAALQSPWCEEEINAAITLSDLRERNGRPRIIPVLTEACQNEMPIFLRSRLYIDFTGNYDDSLHRLIAEGFGAPPENLAPPESPSAVVPQKKASDAKSISPARGKMWLMAVGVIVTLFVVALIAVNSGILSQTPSPTSTQSIVPSTDSIRITNVSPAPTVLLKIGQATDFVLSLHYTLNSADKAMLMLGLEEYPASANGCVGSVHETNGANAWQIGRGENDLAARLKWYRESAVPVGKSIITSDIGFVGFVASYWTITPSGYPDQKIKDFGLLPNYCYSIGH